MLKLWYYSKVYLSSYGGLTVQELSHIFMDMLIAGTSLPFSIPFPFQLGVTIGFSPTTYTVSEDVGNISVTVSLRNGILARDVVVTLQTLDITAMSEFVLKSQCRYGVHTMEPAKSSIIFIPNL